MEELQILGEPGNRYKICPFCQEKMMEKDFFSTFHFEKAQSCVSCRSERQKARRAEAEDKTTLQAPRKEDKPKQTPAVQAQTEPKKQDKHEDKAQITPPKEESQLAPIIQRIISQMESAEETTKILNGDFSQEEIEQKEYILYQTIASLCLPHTISTPQIIDVIDAITEKSSYWKAQLEKEIPGTHYFKIQGVMLHIQKVYPDIKFFKEEKKDYSDYNFNEASADFERFRQAKTFLDKQPVFFDLNGLWWIWNKNTYSYDKTDETTILNGICQATNIDTTNTKTKTEIMNGVRQEGRKRIPEPAKDTWIQFKDIIIDVRTGEQIKSSPKYFITNPIPWKIGKSEDTPTMDKLFGEWVVMQGVQEASYVSTLYEILAYSLLQKQFLHRIFALQGVGSNGKSCFLRILTNFIGEKNISSSSLKLLTNGFETSALYKKKVCIMGEVDTYDMKNTTLLKQLTGEDEIRYEFKGKTAFTEKSGTTCIIATNALPTTPDKSIGFYRRWLIVDFPHIFPGGKDIISEIPNIEYENLANKSIRICKELFENGQFTNEGDVETRMNRYEARSNPLQKFLDENLEDDAESYIIFKDFYKKFLEFLSTNRLRTMTKKAITSKLRVEGYQITAKHIRKDDNEILTTTAIYGVKFKEDTQDSEDSHILSVNSNKNKLDNSLSLISFSTEEHIKDSQDSEDSHISVRSPIGL
jgi:P4 family phage/plasmid primase-like protien